jgi:hypothetical protein
MNRTLLIDFCYLLFVIYFLVSFGALVFWWRTLNGKNIVATNARINVTNTNRYEPDSKPDLSEGDREWTGSSCELSDKHCVLSDKYCELSDKDCVLSDMGCVLTDKDYVPSIGDCVLSDKDCVLSIGDCVLSIGDCVLSDGCCELFADELCIVGWGL